MVKKNLENKFHLKQFSISHDDCGLRVGTDAILLGSWVASLPNFFSKQPTGVLDVGCGSGILTLMMAQAFVQAEVYAIEIDGRSGAQAQKNFTASPFSQRIKLLIDDFTQYRFSRQFDLIISNPPYFDEKPHKGIERKETADAPNISRQTARETICLNYEQLIHKTSQLLTTDGYFAVVLPYDKALQFIGTCAENELYLAYRTDIKTTTRKTTKRVLLAFCRTISPTRHETLILQDSNGKKSEAFCQLTCDFLL